MNTQRQSSKLIAAVFILFFQISLPSGAQEKSAIASLPASIEMYVNANVGTDTSDGSKGRPLRSLSEAARRISNMKGKGGVTLYLSRGIYDMAETADFNVPGREFTKEDRLTIRAEVLPNDKDWQPADMPVLLSTMPFSEEKNERGEVTGGQNFEILIQNSHVTIQGLRVLGEPVHENPSNGILIRNYPIVWEGTNLEDLRITQCLFIGSKYAIPNHLAILSNGKALEVDHCLFYGVKDAVVMWNSLASHSSMHHNLIVDSYGGVVWTWSAAADFRFYNNVISNANIVYVLEKDEKLAFSMENSIVVGYNSIANKGGGPQGFGEKASPNKIKIKKNVVLKNEGRLEIVDDQTSKLYLHIKPETLGSKLGAGLFYRD